MAKENFTVRLMEEISSYNAEMMIDIYLEAKLGKVDVIAELPPNLKDSIISLQKWIDMYRLSGGTSLLSFDNLGTA